MTKLEEALKALPEIKAREEKATKGPWVTENGGTWINADDPYGHGTMHVADVRGWGHLTGTGSCRMPEGKAMEIQEANGDFIAHARADIPLLVAAVEEAGRDREAANVRARAEGHLKVDLLARAEAAEAELTMEKERYEFARRQVDKLAADWVQSEAKVKELRELLAVHARASHCCDYYHSGNPGPGHGPWDFAECVHPRCTKARAAIGGGE